MEAITAQVVAMATMEGPGSGDGDDGGNNGPGSGDGDDGGNNGPGSGDGDDGGNNGPGSGDGDDGGNNGPGSGDGDDGGNNGPGSGDGDDGGNNGPGSGDGDDGGNNGPGSGDGDDGGNNGPGSGDGDDGGSNDRDNDRRGNDDSNKKNKFIVKDDNNVEQEIIIVEDKNTCPTQSENIELSGILNPKGIRLLADFYPCKIVDGGITLNMPEIPIIKLAIMYIDYNGNNHAGALITPSKIQSIDKNQGLFSIELDKNMKGIDPITEKSTTLTKINGLALYNNGDKPILFKPGNNAALTATFTK